MEIDRLIGKNFKDILVQSLAKDTYEVFKEFASNSYDSDATRFEINLNLKKGILRMKDDGFGMDEQGIANFYRMGDSEKIANNMTPLGRHKIGKFGIATILLEYLGSGYKLETYKDGSKITLEEDFDESKDSNSELEYMIDDCNPKKHGTTITVSKLNIDNTFSLNKLRYVMANEMPVSEGFQIWVNGKKSKRKSRKPTAEYYFESDLDNAGLIHGNIYYFDKFNPDAGIYILVHGRAVGSKDHFDLNKVSRVLRGKILARVHADGLHEHVSFDRSRFQEDNTAFTEMISEVYRHLRIVKKDVVKIRDKANINEAKRIVPNVLKSTEDWLENVHLRARKANISSDNKSMREICRISDNLKCVLDNRPLYDGPASFDPKSTTISINASHPLYQIEKSSGRMADLQIKFIFASSIAMANHYTLSHSPAGMKKLIERRESFVANYANKIYGAQNNLIELLSAAFDLYANKDDFNPYRVYTKEEAVDNSELDHLTLNWGVKAGAVQEVTKNKILGKDLLEFMRQLQGYKPAFKVIKEFCEINDIGTSRQNTALKYSKIDWNLDLYKSQIDYIKNIGQKRPFYLVDEDYIDKFTTLYEQGHLKRTKKSIKRLPLSLANRNGRMEDIYVSLADAVDFFGKDLDYVLNIMDTSVQLAMPISKKSRGMTDDYNLSHMISIHNIMEANDHV